jgi:hypothetical protein
MVRKSTSYFNPEKKKYRSYHKLIIAGAIITGISFLVTLVPCKIVDPINTSLGLCKLPNPFTNLDLISTSYYFYGLSNNPISGLAIQFIIATLLSLGVVFLFKKLNKKYKNHKIINLTKK